MWISVQNATIIRATIDGKKVPSKMVEPRDKLWGFYYAAPPPQGIELTISFNPSDRPQITLTDQTNGLPGIPGFHNNPRTEDLMPLNYYPAFDSTTLAQLPHFSGTDAVFSITYDFFRHYNPSGAKS